MRTSGKFKNGEACGSGINDGDTHDYLIYIKQQDALEAPQFISPNDDGANDLFVIRGINSKNSNRLDIFDRIGTTKYQKDNYENTWNGIDTKGNKISEGVYFYRFTNGEKEIKGFMEVRY